MSDGTEPAPCEVQRIMARVAQTVAMLADVVRELEVDDKDDPQLAKRCDVALKAAGWALCALGECSDGEDLGLVCARLIERHNEGIRAKAPS